MKTEAYLFGGVAAFFLVTAVGYGWWSDLEPAGSTALTVSFVMSSAICFFFTQNYRRRGPRPEDHRTSEVADRAGHLGFFPARSPYPVVVAFGAAVTALGIVYALWLFLIGFALVAAAVSGMVFQYVQRGT
jgi:cytochrome c oxidase subunit IV